MTELNNNVIGILEPMTPYMLRNDGVLLSCGTVHPYIKMSNSDTYENNLKTLERHPEFLTWFLSNSTNNETKALLNEFETNKSEDLLNKLNDLTNQEFCRVRTSNYKQKYGGNNGQIYFRISSVGFNWFEFIWKVVARFSSIIKEVTIVKDNQTFGGREFNYYCNHMPSDEFLTMKGNPIMENKNALLESLTAAQKQKLSDVWDCLEQNDFIDIDNCTDDALALRNIDENLVEKLKAMLGKSPATLQHLASFLEAHTFETLMNLGLFKDTQIKSVNIPNSVASIGNEAFADCKSLTSVMIPNSVTSIGEYAFYRCGSLTSVIIPNSVTIISDDAFYRCGSLTSVIIPDSVTIISDGAFADCESLASVIIPNSVTSIGNWAFSDCHVLASVDIPNSVTSIGASAFYRCKSLTSVNIPNSVASIGNVAFANCESLASVNIPNSVASIGNGAFANCESLASVDIPNSVTSIDDAAFYSCESLTSVNIPNSVASIGKDTFSWCRSLASINIPNSVASIGDEAFSYCHSLESIILEKGIDKSVEDKLRKEYGTKVKLQENLAENLTQLEESPEKHDTLNPKLWDIEKNELKPEVSDKVLEIAKDFTDGLDEDEVKYKLLDIKLVGSNCSYNYNKASDLDVHLVFDLSIYDDDEKEKMAELLYNYARSLWNKNHTVEFYGIPVEIYVETENSEDKNILENADKENDLTPREGELIIEASNGPFEEISFEDLCKL